MRTRASTRAAAQSGTPSRLAPGRHRVLRALALSAATLLVLELLYIVAIPTFVNRKLAAVAAEGGLDLQVDSLRSWYPGDLRATSIRPASFGLELAATLEQQRESGALGIVSGALTARQVEFAGHTPPSERPDFTVALEATTWRIADQWRISGKLDGHGKNAGFLMDLFAAGPGVRLMLDELRGQAFQISSHVALDDSMLSFEHIALTASSMAARGSIFLPRTPLFGAVLVERGAFRLGLVFDEASMRTRLAPPRDWLEQTLASFVVPTAN